MEHHPLTIVKIGGNIVDDEVALHKFLNDFGSISGAKILVHGGGKIATELSKSMGILPKMIEGRRVTDSETLKIVTMIYGGLINKQITARLQALGTDAIGMTGADGKIILAHKRKTIPIDYGYVGDIDRVDAQKIHLLLQNGLSLVIAPLTYDLEGNILNTNADSVASQVAIAMSQIYSVQFFYCFEKKGLLQNVEDENSIIPHIQIEEIQNLKENGTITAGMIPKVDNIYKAIQNGVQQVRLCHAGDISKILKHDVSLGTLFTQ